jgi:hypothetical protein
MKTFLLDWSEQEKNKLISLLKIYIPGFHL